MRREIVTTTRIAAAPEVVWGALVAFDRFPEWNPFIPSIRGVAEPGARLEVTIVPPGRRPMAFRPEVLRALPGQELSWLGRLGVAGLFDGEHRFVLAADDGGTELTQRETFSGILVPLLWRRLAGPVRQGFEAMNAALKQHVEGG
ncbi:SRPBCC domain-containing protein [Aquisalimonas lutea]|uniref:SRPBCC domain-containing protein n=1 Tax=Aquisalimonas lutea TaxID=1327750 RepID=UPI0025B39B29|nr:SRPBCC domain-containing protein [Aquisalimonas lutea]MDN3517351.1 SRPBCC domain-containing protein [Aquisalimonas lutea]